MRSDLIKQYPDLKVEAPFPSKGGGPERKRAPILRHEIIGNGILLYLLDRSPNSEEMPMLTFTQPPHQQTFARIGIDEELSNRLSSLQVASEARLLNPLDERKSEEALM